MGIRELLNLFFDGKATAKSHMKSLIEMAVADGHFDPEEQALLIRIASKNNVSESQLEKIRENPETVKFELPADRRERFHQFYDLVHMMSVDKSIHPEELKLCNLYAIRFGYKRENAKELIETIQSNIKYGQGHDETMNRVGRLIA
jgi:uncharacterized tellurite resistance protein B-like protein